MALFQKMQLSSPLKSPDVRVYYSHELQVITECHTKEVDGASETISNNVISLKYIHHKKATYNVIRKKICIKL